MFNDILGFADGVRFYFPFWMNPLLAKLVWFDSESKYSNKVFSLSFLLRCNGHTWREGFGMPWDSDPSARASGINNRLNRAPNKGVGHLCDHSVALIPWSFELNPLHIASKTKNRTSWNPKQLERNGCFPIM